MDFLIVNTTGTDLTIDQPLLNKYITERASLAASMSYNTAYNNYKAGVLTVTVQIALVAGGTKIAEAKQVSKFNFPDKNTLTRGASKKAIATLKDCIDLAQAHAYGNFAYRASDLDLGLLPAGVAPIELYEDEIKIFLKKISKL